MMSSTLCRSTLLYWCARFLVPPIRSTCLRSANLYWCALIETTIVSSSYVSEHFCIGVPLLKLQSYHHQQTSYNHTTLTHTHIICHQASSSVSCTLLYHLLFSNIITLCRSASLYCCARFLVPPIRSTCLRSANLYWCARIETTIVSSSYVSQQFCIGVPLLRLQSYHHQYTSHNHYLIRA